MTAAAITKSDVHATSLSAGTELDARRRSGHGPGRRAHGLGEAQGGLVAVAQQAGPIRSGRLSNASRTKH